MILLNKLILSLISLKNRRRRIGFDRMYVTDRRRHVRLHKVYTRCVQKVSQILCYFKNYLFLHEYLFRPFKVIPTRYYILVPRFFPILEALQKTIFCDLVQLRLRCCLYLLNRSVSSSFNAPLQFREQEKVTGGHIWVIRCLLLQKIIFCDLVQLLLRCRLYLLNRSVASSFHGPLQFREQENVSGARSGDRIPQCCFWPKIRFGRN